MRHLTARGIAPSALLLTVAAGLALAAPPPAPVLLEPAASARLDNGRLDRDDDLEWRFRWTAVDGATGYQLRVVAPGGERAVAATAFTLLRCGPSAGEGACAWRVRARVDGTWGAWSEERAFQVGPAAPDRDPGAASDPPVCASLPVVEPWSWPPLDRP